MSLLPGEHTIMLKKKLCVKCWNNYAKSFNEEKVCLRWNKDDEECWKRRVICCPNKYKEKENNPRYITEQPPDNCPFMLEHILSNEDIK